MQSDLGLTLLQEHRRKDVPVAPGRVMRKPTLSICENKDSDQRRAADHHCFRHKESTIALHPKSVITSVYPSARCMPDLAGNPEDSFHVTLLYLYTGRRCPLREHLCTRKKFLAYWVIFHAFLSSADLFSKLIF